MMPLTLVLHFPNGERQYKSGVYDGGLAWEYFGVYPVGFKRKKCYIVYDSDIGYQQSMSSTFIPGLYHLERVVDIDVNSVESMKKDSGPSDSRSSSSSNIRRVSSSSGKKEIEKTPVNKDGVSMSARCAIEFNTQVSTFLDGYLMDKNDVAEKKFSMQDFVTGAAAGGMIVMVLLKILELNGGVIG